MIGFQHREPDGDLTAFTTWAEGLKLRRYSFGKSNLENKFGAYSRRLTTQTDGEGGFRWFAKHAENDDDIISPKLWSPTRQSAENSPNHEQLQPASRVVEIARYRHEMMGLVRDAPESAYELSLQDLVELPTVRQVQKMEKKGVRRLSRCESMDAGVLTLKLFSPFSVGGNWMKRSSSSNSKVSPKKANGGEAKTADMERCNQNECGERSSSCCNSIKYGSRKLTGCWSILPQIIKARRKRQEIN